MQKQDELLIAALSTKVDWTTAKQLSAELSISVRSVKYSISNINDEFNDLILSSRYGYKINKESYSSYIKEKGNTTTSSIPKDYGERKHYIVNMLLLENKKMSISQLSDTLYVSTSTIQNELRRIRTDLDKYHLNVHVKNEIVTITGLEKDKHAVMIDFLNEEIKDSAFSISAIQKLFKTVNLKTVEHIIRGTISDYQYFLDDYSLLNYVLHISLTIEIKSNLSSNNADESKKNNYDISQLGTHHVQLIVNELYKRLKKVYNTDYTLDDIFESSILMMTRAVSKQVTDLSIENLSDVLDSDITDLLNIIIASVEKTYGMSLSNDNFEIRFGFHLKNLIDRLKYNIKITNLEFGDIKNNYPLIYAISVYISSIITKETKLEMPEDEISYIALHIGVLIQEKQDVANKISCILICPSYNDIAKKLSDKISSIFSDSIIIANVLPNFDNKDELLKVDLILSTLPIPITIGSYKKIINPFLSEDDITSIFSLINEIKSAKTKNLFKEKIQYFFHEDLFYIDKAIKDRDSAIEYMCDDMFKKGYVSKEYKSQIYEHERISSSSYGNVAITHPLDVKSKESVISLAICPDSIVWGTNNVNLIFMLAVTEEDKDLFSDVFNFITKIIANDDTYNHIINSTSFEEFINILVSLY